MGLTSVPTPPEERADLALNRAPGSRTQIETVGAADLKETTARYSTALPSA